jgi:hypothetical protein
LALLQLMDSNWIFKEGCERDARVL